MRTLVLLVPTCALTHVQKGDGAAEVVARKREIEAGKKAAVRGSLFYRVTVKVRGSRGRCGDGVV